MFLKFLGHIFLVTVSYVQIVPHETPRACASVGHTEREKQFGWRRLQFGVSYSTVAQQELGERKKKISIASGTLLTSRCQHSARGGSPLKPGTRVYSQIF